MEKVRVCVLGNPENDVRGESQPLVKMRLYLRMGLVCQKEIKGVADGLQHIHKRLYKLMVVYYTVFLYTASE